MVAMVVPVLLQSMPLHFFPVLQGVTVDKVVTVVQVVMPVPTRL